MRSHQYQFIDPLFLMQIVADDLDLFCELSTIFINTAPPMFDRLSRAIVKDDSKATRFESHALKGSTSLVGASQLSAMLEEVERQSRLGEQALIGPCLPELTRLFDAVMQEIQASIIRCSGDAEQSISSQLEP
ncbi:Hpt domain-containing protein [Actimicrobium antarcticum]|uniref:HPt domain-containing protein n=1 Tax=Actimicrobium antarcticum TaxID=1051899 RepID=A0ABP7TPS4_9BURK